MQELAIINLITAAELRRIPTNRAITVQAVDPDTGSVCSAIFTRPNTDTVRIEHQDWAGKHFEIHIDLPQSLAHLVSPSMEGQRGAAQRIVEMVAVCKKLLCHEPLPQ